jgi:MFS family permease
LSATARPRVLTSRATVLSTAYSIVAGFPLFIVAAESVGLQRDLHFGKAQLGLAISIGFLASALVAAPFGRHFQRVGPSPGLRLSALLTLVALWAIASASSWWQVAPALAIGGMGNACAQVSANLSLAAGVAPMRQGVAFALKQAALPIASILAGISVPLLASAGGWRMTCIVASGAALAGVLLRPGIPPAPAKPTAHDDGRRSSTLMLIAVVGLFAGAAGASVAAFTVDAAVAHSFGPGGAGLLLAVGSLSAVVGRLASGWVVDRRDSPGLSELAILGAVGAASFLLVSVSGDDQALFVLGIIGCFAAGWGWPGIIYYATVRSHGAAPGISTGVVLSWVYVGNLAGPVGTGLLVQHVSYTVAWLAGAIALALAAVAALVARLQLPRLQTSNAAR